MDKATLEGLKEFARMVAIAVIPTLVLAIESNNFDWKVVSVALVLALLRALDRWAHKSPSVPVDGLAPWEWKANS